MGHLAAREASRRVHWAQISEVGLAGATRRQLLSLA
jgi:hypothetical protein